ncbi:MAG: PQQ-like beta-propeller repeat protein, partial [Anaerolineae bacterium]|nr:PQQ-like beta-propeller repeat protein [Anaerolineae bacterium]
MRNDKLVLILTLLFIGALLSLRTEIASAQSNSYVATQSQGWRMGGGNPTNSHWNAAETDLYPPLERVWTWSASNERFLPDSITYIPYGSANGIVYVSGMGRDDKNVVYAVDVYARQSRWRYQLIEGGGAMNHHVAVTWPYAVFGGQHDDYLYIVDASEGTTLSITPGFESLYAKPAKIFDSTVFACGNGFCSAISLYTGNIVWTQNTRSGSASSDIALAYNTLVGPTPADYPGTEITLFSSSTGQVLLQTGATRGHSVVTDGNRIY